MRRGMGRCGEREQRHQDGRGGVGQASAGMLARRDGEIGRQTSDLAAMGPCPGLRPSVEAGSDVHPRWNHLKQTENNNPSPALSLLFVYLVLGTDNKPCLLHGQVSLAAEGLLLDSVCLLPSGFLTAHLQHLT